MEGTSTDDDNLEDEDNLKEIEEGKETEKELDSSTETLPSSEPRISLHVFKSESVDPWENLPV